jgi:hypothetical protein
MADVKHDPHALAQRAPAGISTGMVRANRRSRARNSRSGFAFSWLVALGGAVLPDDLARPPL